MLLLVMCGSLLLPGCAATSSGPATVAIDLTAPTDGSAVTTRFIEVIGTVNPSDAQVIVADRPVRVINGQFKMPLVLRRRLTRIKILASAPHYRSATLVTSVRYGSSQAVSTVTGKARSMLVSPPTGALSGAWWRWFFALRVHDSSGRVIDPALISGPPGGSGAAVNCAYGQTGSIWFLSGTFGSAEPANRSCTVPRGITLVFPIINIETTNDHPGAAHTSLSISELRRNVAEAIDSISSMSATVDGVPVPDLSEALSDSPYRVVSPVFSYTLPTDNVFEAAGQNALPQVVTGVVGDGVYVKVKPLAVGTHALHWQGVEDNPAFSQNVTYHITVKP